ncbi:17409_t:CDS:1, partial [Gigaspora rosea]
NKVVKDEPKVHVNRPKILPVRYHKKGDQVNYIKSESYGIKIGKENLTEGYEVLEAACIVWRLKGETFKAQNKAPECRNQKNNISKDLDSA